MLIGLIRPIETRTVEVKGEGLRAIAEQLAAPEGWELVSAPALPAKGTTELHATATFARRDGLQQIEAEDRDALLAKVPEGWQLLSIRRG
ncbi:hypothetical protein [Microbacterium caowuchunii]|uniref:Uncharacterized protein n=1 Tax=Microbacterium caowuchunii TaxID=2614638 RepID=A0A5N0TJH9_9MICO|nr:hypothetical protein [Microbacterium caowuchunii]KAA9135220.1 hypothetical protein F6B40_05995 [Microbacterium caowuchunii]